MAKAKQGDGGEGQGASASGDLPDGVIVAPVLAAVGAVATLLSNFTVVVERAQRGPGPSRPANGAAAAGSGFGATEDQVDMKDTVAQRVDSKGTKLEDIAGVGEHDSQGG